VPLTLKMLGKIFNKSSSSKHIDISHPIDTTHTLHVDSNLNWGEKGSQAFEIEEKLGEGSFGVVYRARHKDSGYPLAIKDFDVYDVEEADPIAKEIEILKKCNHPHVVSYFGSCSPPSKLWILMDYCGLGSLNDVMNSLDRPFKEKEIALICQQSLVGLIYLHSKQIIHRDVKAANILLTDNGRIKIADFGVSQQILSTFSKGSIAGTPYWMAPEILKQEKYSNKVDVWSLGITAIEIAEGSPPLIDINPVRAMYMVPRRPPPTLKEPKKWSKEFNSFIETCLVKEIDKRPTPVELLEHPFIQGAKPDALKDLVQTLIKSRKRKSKGGKVEPIQPSTYMPSRRSGAPTPQLSSPTSPTLDTGSVVYNDTIAKKEPFFNNNAANTATAGEYDSVILKPNSYKTATLRGNVRYNSPTSNNNDDNNNSNNNNNNNTETITNLHKPNNNGFKNTLIIKKNQISKAIFDKMSPESIRTYNNVNEKLQKTTHLDIPRFLISIICLIVLVIAIIYKFF